MNSEIYVKQNCKWRKTFFLRKRVLLLIDRKMDPHPLSDATETYKSLMFVNICGQTFIFRPTVILIKFWHLHLMRYHKIWLKSSRLLRRMHITNNLTARWRNTSTWPLKLVTQWVKVEIPLFSMSARTVPMSTHIENTTIYTMKV